jgi:hypothetical protein
LQQKTTEMQKVMFLSSSIVLKYSINCQSSI